MYYARCGQEDRSHSRYFKQEGFNIGNYLLRKFCRKPREAMNQGQFKQLALWQSGQQDLQGFPHMISKTHSSRGGDS